MDGHPAARETRVLLVKLIKLNSALNPSRNQPLVIMCSAWEAWHTTPFCLRHFALALCHFRHPPFVQTLNTPPIFPTNDNNANMRVDSTSLPPSLQGFRVGNGDVLYIKSRRDNTTGQCIILWKDILQAFGDVKHVRDGPTIVSFVTDDDFEL